MARLGHRGFRLILLRNQVLKSLMETPGNKLLTARPVNPWHLFFDKADKKEGNFHVICSACKNTNKLDTTQRQH